MPVSEAVKSSDVFLTVKGNNLYVHLNKDPMADSVELPPLEMLPEKAVLLNDGRELRVVRNQGTKHWAADSEYLRIKSLPTDEMTDQVMVIRLEYRHLPSIVRELASGWKLSLPSPIKQKEDR